MTVEVAERPETWTVLAVLRRGQLDARDAAIIRAVARSERSTMRSIVCDTEIRSISTVHYRIRGYAFNQGRCRRVGGGLIERGWLLWEPLMRNVLRPGPRFAGLDSDGWPLEVVRE